MTEELQKKLKEEVNEANWPMLSIHHKRDALLFVDSSLDLVDVGIAIAKDNVQEVGLWQLEKKLRVPSAEDLQNLQKKSTEYLVNFLIIQPFVLISLK